MKIYRLIRASAAAALMVALVACQAPAAGQQASGEIRLEAGASGAPAGGNAAGPASGSRASAEVNVTAAPVSQPLSDQGQVPAIATEIRDATVTVKELPFPVTSISGKVKWMKHVTEISDVGFRLLDSSFKASGVIGKGSVEHDFTVTSDAVNFEDLKKLFPILSQFGISGNFKFSCRVTGTKDDPKLAGTVSLPSASFDFGSLLPELAGIKVSSVSSGFSYSKSRYAISDFSFNTMGGRVSLAGEFSPAAKDDASVSIKVSGLDALSLSKFSDKYAGKITGSLNAAFRISHAASASKAFAEGDINLSNGTLRNFEPLMRLGDRLKAAGLDNLDYSRIGGHFAIRPDKSVKFDDFEIVSEIVRAKTSGSVDPAGNLSAKLFAELTGGGIGDRIKNDKLGKILKKVASGLKGNFNVSGTTKDPKVELDLGR